MTKPTEAQIQKKAAELSRITGEKILWINFYSDGDYVVLCETENAAQKLFDHYNYCKTSKSKNTFNNTWYVIIYEWEKINR